MKIWLCAHYRHPSWATVYLDKPTCVLAPLTRGFEVVRSDFPDIKDYFPHHGSNQMAEVELVVKTIKGVRADADIDLS